MPLELALEALRDFHERAAQRVTRMRGYDRCASVSRFAHLALHFFIQAILLSLQALFQRLQFGLVILMAGLPLYFIPKKLKERQPEKELEPVSK